MSGISFISTGYEYDGVSHSLTTSEVLPTGLDGVKITVSYTGSVTNVSDGMVTATAVFATNSDNYNTPSTLTAQIWITARIAELNWTSNSELVYDKLHKTLSAQVVNLVLGEACDVSVQLTDGNDDINAGSFSYTATALSNGNYTLVGCENATSNFFTITRRTAKVKADAKSIVHGENDIALTYTTEGILEGDTLSGTLSRQQGTEPAKYNITIGTLQNRNYNIVFESAVYTIKTTTVETVEKNEKNIPEAKIGSEEGFDPDAELVLRAIPFEDLDSRLAIPSGKRFVKGYELILLIGGVPVEMEGEWTVTFAAPSDSHENQEYEVIAIEDDQLSTITAKVENGLITMNMASQNSFAIIGDKTVDTLLVEILFIIIIFEIAMIFFLYFYMGKQKIKYKKTKKTYLH